MLLRQGLTLTALGLGVGLAVSVASARFLASLLYEIRVTDPMTFAGVCVVLVTVSFCACYIPARRATKVDPMVALRCE
jgi:ABC-type antimicrobial peptide transport system permease subunit